MTIKATAERMGRAALPVTLVFLSFALMWCVPAAKAASKEQQDLVKRTVANHEKNIELQMSRLQEAEKLRSQGEFRKALAIVDQVRLECSSGRTHCSDDQAKRYAKVRDKATAAKENIHTDFAAVTLKDARKLAAEQKYEKAILRADEAVKINPALNEKVTAFKSYCQAKIKDRDFSSAVKVENFQPQHKPTADQIDKLYHEATVLYDNGRYSETIKKLEEIYVLDPLNTRATHLLEMTYRKVYTAATQRQIAEARGITAHGSWVWVEPQLPSGPVVKRQAEVKVEGNEMQRRMDDIILPEVELADGTDISSALNYLRQQAKEYDTQKGDDNGIVFLYSNGGADAAAPAAGADKDQKGSEAAAADTTSSVKVSEMKFTNISLNDALRYICMETGMRYRIDGNTVVVGRDIEVTRDASFSVPRALINGILGNDAIDDASPNVTESAATGSKVDSFGSAKSEEDKSDTGNSANKDSEKLISYFSKRGVSFGPNSKITYNGRTGKLLVSNTPDNLRRLDELLRQLSVITTPMVMTEIKVIQIKEDDLEELSFYWQFTMEKNSFNIQANTTGVVRKSTQVLQPFKGLGGTSLIENFSIFPGLADIGANLSVDVNALSQHTNTETIQAPRLISESGREAWIKMVTRCRFPESWDAPSIETNGAATTVQMPLPNLGEYTEYGTKLNVTPRVMADNYTIELNLFTEIKDAKEGPKSMTSTASEASTLKDNVYEVKIDRGYIDADGARHSYTPQYPQYYHVWLPEFDTHSLEVKLKVFDGQTIVMGGVTSTTTYRMEDRTPILSEIPVLGRLFTAKAEANKKATLLFFVTARLIDSYGRPLNSTTDDRGIPQFN